MKEIPVTFKNKKQKLVGIFHIPNMKTDSAVIIAHGFTGYKREVQHVNCARELCKNGFGVLRFDFRGSGGSDGLFRNMTISGEVSDLEKSIEFVRNKGYKKIGLIGHSLGGAVVILANKKNVSTIVLWAPSVIPKKILTQLLGENNIEIIEKQGYAPVSWEGKSIEFIVGKPFWTEVKNKYSDILDKLLAIDIPTTVIYGSEDWRWFKLLKSKSLFRKLQQPENNLKIIHGADHVFSMYNHENQLIDYTVNWFKKWLK